MSKARAFKFNFTIFDDTTEEFLQTLECRYIVYGYEFAPDTNRPHFEGYVYFENPRSLQATRTLFHSHGAGYFDIAKGSSIQNYNYSTKDGQFYERGVRPLTDAEKGSTERERHKRARELAMSGNFEDIDSDLYTRYQSSYKRMYLEDRPPPTDLEGEGDLKVGLWIYGPPGSGKSRLARQMYPELYLKDLNKWWDRYQGQPYVLIEDFAPEHTKELVAYLKRWTDRYVFSGEYKGGSGVFRPQKIVITSNYPMDECFSGVDFRALNRRFEVILKN